MSCRFQNAERELNNCTGALHFGRGALLLQLPGDEFRAAIKLISLCREVAMQFDGINLEQMWKDRTYEAPPARK